MKSTLYTLRFILVLQYPQSPRLEPRLCRILCGQNSNFDLIHRLIRWEVVLEITDFKLKVFSPWTPVDSVVLSPEVITLFRNVKVRYADLTVHYKWTCNRLRTLIF